MRVMIVDDHAVYRAGLRGTLQARAGLEVVAEAATGREALRLADELRPDLVLLDLSLPGIDGVIVARELRRRLGDVKILIVSVHDQTPDVLDALTAGANGYVAKAEALEALMAAVEAVSRGEGYLSPTLRDRVAPYRNKGAVDTLSVLSEREREVFRLAATGLSNEEIGRQLCISRKTVDTHRYRINGKLRLRTPIELFRLAAALGLMQLGPRRPVAEEARAEPAA